PGLVPDQHHAGPGAAPALRLLRRRIPRRVPDRIGSPIDAQRDRRRPLAPPDLDLLAGRKRPPARLRRSRGLPDRPPLARPPPLLRVLPRRRRRRHRRQPPDRLDRHRRQPARSADGGCPHRVGVAGLGRASNQSARNSWPRSRSPRRVMANAARPPPDAVFAQARRSPCALSSPMFSHPPREPRPPPRSSNDRTWPSAG